MKKEVGDDLVSIGGQLVVFDPERIYITLFYLVTTYHRHPKRLPEQLGECRLTGTGPSGDDHAFWFFGHFFRGQAQFKK